MSNDNNNQQQGKKQKGQNNQQKGKQPDGVSYSGGNTDPTDADGMSKAGSLAFSFLCSLFIAAGAKPILEKGLKGMMSFGKWIANGAEEKDKPAAISNPFEMLNTVVDQLEGNSSLKKAFLGRAKRMGLVEQALEVIEAVEEQEAATAEQEVETVEPVEEQEVEATEEQEVDTSIVDEAVQETLNDDSVM